MTGNPATHRFTLAQRLLITAVVCLICCGCVRRRLLVRSNPPGASVYADKQLIGTTPASSSFTYYGTREFEVVADGYRTEKVLRNFSPPWYQIPPLDFFSETLWPGELRDERIVDITLVPEQPIASDALQRRADNLRMQAAQGLATPLPPTAGGGPDFRDQPLLPGTPPPTRPIDPTYRQPGQFVPGREPQQPPEPVWRPGQFLRDFFFPGGRAPTRIPESGILPGGSYRPSLDDT